MFPATVTQTQLDDEVRSAILKFGPDVVNVKYNLGEDNDGDPSIFFRIVLTDSASREEVLADVSGDIVKTLYDELRPYEKGLIPYFRFRSQSEYVMMNDRAWA